MYKNLCIWVRIRYTGFYYAISLPPFSNDKNVKDEKIKEKIRINENI